MTDNYFTARLTLLAAHGIEVDQATEETTLKGLMALNLDSLGKVILQQVEHVLNAETRLEDADGWLESKIASVRAGVTRGLTVTEQVGSLAADFERAVALRNAALDTLGSLAKVWLAGHQA